MTIIVIMNLYFLTPSGVNSNKGYGKDRVNIS